MAGSSCCVADLIAIHCRDLSNSYSLKTLAVNALSLYSCASNFSGVVGTSTSIPSNADRWSGVTCSPRCACPSFALNTICFPSLSLCTDGGHDINIQPRLHINSTGINPVAVYFLIFDICTLGKRRIGIQQIPQPCEMIDCHVVVPCQESQT